MERIDKFKLLIGDEEIEIEVKAEITPI